MAQHFIGQRGIPADLLPLIANRTFSPAGLSALIKNANRSRPRLDERDRLAAEGSAARTAGLREEIRASELQNTPEASAISLQEIQSQIASRGAASEQGKERNVIGKIRAMADRLRAQSTSRENQPAAEETLRSILGDDLFEATKAERFSVGNAIDVKRSRNVGRELTQRQDRLDFDEKRSGNIRSERDRRQDLRESEADRKLSGLALKIDDLMRDNKIDTQTGETLKQLMAQSAGIRGETAVTRGAINADAVLQLSAEDKADIEGQAMQLIDADPQFDNASEAEKRRAADPIAQEIFRKRIEEQTR